MHISRKSTGLIIFLSSIAIIGLSIVQVNWINKSIETNSQIFRQKLDIAAMAIENMSRAETEFLKGLDHKLKSAHLAEVKNEIDYKISGIVDTVFAALNLPLVYETGIYAHGESPSSFEHVYGHNGPLDLGQPCNINPSKNFVWLPLTCGRGFGKQNSYHMAIFFPNENQYLFEQIKGTLITAIFFMLLLITTFSYTIITLRNQKKISQIKEDFISNLTHEFKTPIFSIGLASKIIKESDELKESEKLNKHIDIINSENQRLKAHVDKVLQLAMIDSGNLKLEKKRIDLHLVIAKIAENFSHIIKEQKGKLELSLMKQDSWLYADEMHLSNIVSNLLDNAIKYSKNAPEIIISTFKEDSNICIAVKDNGIGIDTETQKYIFDRFYRLEQGNIHNVKGFGLGLSYVKNIVEAHKGWITLTSQPDKGSEFIVGIPAY